MGDQPIPGQDEDIFLGIFCDAIIMVSVFLSSVLGLVIILYWLYCFVSSSFHAPARFLPLSVVYG